MSVCQEVQCCPLNIYQFFNTDNLSRDSRHGSAVYRHRLCQHNQLDRLFIPKLYSFVVVLREARKEVDEIKQQLVSLEGCLQLLQTHSENETIKYPPTLKDTVLQVLQNFERIGKEMSVLIGDLSSNGGKMRLQWASTNKEELMQMSSKLEAHKLTISMALDFATLFTVSEVKDDTEAIRDDTRSIKSKTAHIPLIKEQTAQIGSLMEELIRLRESIADHEQSRGHNFILGVFLAESSTIAVTAYAGSVADDAGTSRLNKELAQASPADRSVAMQATASKRLEQLVSRGDNIQRTPLLPEVQKNKVSSARRTIQTEGAGHEVVSRDTDHNNSHHKLKMHIGSHRGSLESRNQFERQENPGIAKMLEVEPIESVEHQADDEISFARNENPEKDPHGKLRGIATRSSMRSNDEPDKLPMTVDNNAQVFRSSHPPPIDIYSPNRIAELFVAEERKAHLLSQEIATFRKLLTDVPRLLATAVIPSPDPNVIEPKLNYRRLS